jgi:ComF family protein
MSNPTADPFDNSRAIAAHRGTGSDTAAPTPTAIGAQGIGADSPRGATAWAVALGRCLPQRCALCSAACGPLLVCADCDRSLPRLPPACPRCALPTPLGAECGSCIARAPPFARAIAAFAYAFPLDRLLQALKYSGHLALAEFFAEALARSVRVWPDALVALPLSPQRQRARGYNQAGEIARALAARGRTPLVDALVRTRDTPPQAGLQWAERAHNVRGAFALRTSVAGLRIAIVDDVMTTGATLRAAATAVRDAGACEVDVWVVARTLPPAQPP